MDSPCVPWPLAAGVQWGDDETETLLAILLDGQHHEKLQTRQHSQTYRAVAEQLWEQRFLRTPEQCRTKFNSLWSRYHKVRPGRVPELSVLNEEVDAVSGSWASAPKVASRAVPGQEGRAAESGERSQQNGEPTEVGEGVWADGAAGDEEDFRDPSWEGGDLTCQSCSHPELVGLLTLTAKGQESPRAHYPAIRRERSLLLAYSLP